MSPRQLFSVIFAAPIALMLFISPSAAIDTTRPIFELCPEPLADTPDEPPLKTAPEADDPASEDQLMELINEARWDNGELAPLKRVESLDGSSETHSANMATRNFFMHCDPDTLTQFWDRMLAVGYSFSSAAENIAAGSSTPAAAMALWMASPGHRANILSTSFREVGTGYVHDAGDAGNIRQSTTGSCTPNLFNQGPWYHYWTQNFGLRSSVYPVVINREAYLTESCDVDLYVYGSFAEMRFRNEGGAWSTWQPFANDTTWQLSSGSGVKTVHAEVRTGRSVYSSSDTIHLEDANSLIFADGFESGDTSAWSDVLP